MHPRSADWFGPDGWAHGGHNLHPDFGSIYQGRLNGIPYNVVGTATPRVQVGWNTDYDYRDESDSLPAEGLPIPADVKIEGDPRPWGQGDHHLILWDQDRNEIHELYNMALAPDGSLLTNQYSRFPNSNALRKDGDTSADVAGLAILPGLVRYDEVESGEINHCLRYTAELNWGYVWPARHPALSGDARFPPMGSRVRLRSDFDIGGFAPRIQTILRCLKKYGMMLADNGSDYFISGAPDSRWDDEELGQLKSIRPDTCFDFVDCSGMMIDPNSGQARAA